MNGLLDAEESLTEATGRIDAAADGLTASGAADPELAGLLADARRILTRARHRVAEVAGQAA